MPEKTPFYGAKFIKWSLILSAIGLLTLFAVCLAIDRHSGQKPSMNEQERELWEMTLDLGDTASKMIHQLYEEKREGIEEYSEQLFALWSYAGSIEEAESDYDDGLCVEPPYLFVSKNSEGTGYELQLCDTSFELQEREWECPEELGAFFDVLWSEYEVEYVYLTPDFISFQIKEDRLTYHPREYRIGFHEAQLDEHWSHFWFPYGV